jgi:hypothetical protein
MKGYHIRIDDVVVLLIGIMLTVYGLCAKRHFYPQDPRMPWGDKAEVMPRWAGLLLYAGSGLLFLSVEILRIMRR